MQPPLKQASNEDGRDGEYGETAQTTNAGCSVCRSVRRVEVRTKASPASQLPSSPASAPSLPARDGRPDSKVRMPRFGLSERHVHVPIPPRHTIKTRGKQAFVASIDLPRLLAPDALEIWPSSS